MIWNLTTMIRNITQAYRIFQAFMNLFIIIIIYYRLPSQVNLLFAQLIFSCNLPLKVFTFEGRVQAKAIDFGTPTQKTKDRVPNPIKLILEASL